MFKALDRISIGMLLIAALTLGLSPFVPEPHVWEKIKMLASGTLTQPMDIFDLAFHGIPWVLLVLKLGRMGLKKGA
ncbi:RND transporter [Cohaesibacter celericrescens]|uniref:RND transporter n=1 Tax=Cohaesibacter celericrescens TaxID=2067669 RepID=A0A2N5XV18_9HYPH|nr:RND transporter [Cohaesibacter celericrescens]PLW78362.1 RND transporter [Cohaesibacter celericrescens]